MVVPSPPPPAACRTCGQSFRDDVLICPHDGSHLPLEHRLLDGKYRLEKRIGHGAMAAVWRATHELIQRPVAIKLMHTSYADDADLLARFRNEATAAGRIGSPHICDVLDFGRSEIGPYIVMELLSGCSLSDLMQRHQRLDPGLAVWIVRQTLEGLDAAHRAGIVHRDLKPENIHLARAIRDQWLVKLVDFGISKFVDSLRTGAGTMMGSPNYMAPEQIHGAAAVDARADVWSIGAILFEALAGEQAFARDTIADSLAAVRGYDPPPVHTLAPEVPPGLSTIVARCLRKRPEQRWPSARALSDALLPYEQPGPRAQLLPTAPTGDLAPASRTHPRSGVAPRALAEGHAAALHRNVAGAKPRTGAHAPLPAARSAPTGAHAPVPAARSATTGAHAPVPAARSAPTGAHAPVPAARSATTGAHAPVPATRSPSTGAHAPVPAGDAPAKKVTHPGTQPLKKPTHPGTQPLKKPTHPGVQPAPALQPLKKTTYPGAPLPAPRSRAGLTGPQPTAGGPRPPATGPHPPVAGTRAPATGPHPPVPGTRAPATGPHPPVASNRSHSTGPNPPVARTKPRAATGPRPSAAPASGPAKAQAPAQRRPSRRQRAPVDPRVIVGILVLAAAAAAALTLLAR